MSAFCLSFFSSSSRRGSGRLSGDKDLRISASSSRPLLPTSGDLLRSLPAPQAPRQQRLSFRGKCRGRIAALLLRERLLAGGSRGAAAIGGLWRSIFFLIVACA